MWKERIIIVICWSLCSAVCSAGIVYLGANTLPYQEQWLRAGLTGGAVGAVAAIVALLILGDRKWMLLLGIVFALVQATLSASLIWRISDSRV
jgi:hypothetical protein